MINTAKIRIGRTVILLFTAALVIGIIVLPGAAVSGVVKGMDQAAKLLIPSLFPFMVLSSFIIRTESAEIIGKLFAPLTRLIFGLPGEASPAIVFGLVGGYPVGASCVKLLYEKRILSFSQAQRMVMFCFCPGPAFLITAVGSILLGNFQSGVLLYISQLLAVVIIGMIYRFADRGNGRYADNKSGIHHTEETKLTDQFVMSCYDGAETMLRLAAMVIVFSMIVSILETAMMPEIISGLLHLTGIPYVLSEQVFYITLEVTGACTRIASGGCPLWVLSLASGFGGICVHFQIFSIAGDLIGNKAWYIAVRSASAVLSAVITRLLCIFFDPVSSTFSEIDTVSTELFSATAAGAAALVIMSAAFLLSMKRSYYSVCGGRAVRYKTFTKAD